MRPLPKQWPKRFCPVCGNELYRKRGPKLGRLESSTNFLKRKTCGPVCAAKNAIDPLASSNNYRRRARKYRKDHCEICGYSPNGNGSPQLEVHHKDGDWHNNDPSNLQTLCRSCHRDEDLKRVRNDSVVSIEDGF